MDLNDLKKQWYLAKQAETNAKEQRLRVEERILEQVDFLPESGSTEVCNGLEVRTSLRTKYDQNKLMRLYMEGKIENFPFEKEFKPINSELKYLQKNSPEQFKLIEECAETVPAKPSFKIKEGK